MKLSQKLKQKRKQMNISIRELEARTKISNCSISQYENGLVMPNFENAAKLSRVLEFSLDELAKDVKI